MLQFAAMYLVAGMVMAVWLMWQPEEEGEERTTALDILNLILFWPLVLVVILKLAWDERNDDVERPR